jgi:pimeloyl-ACP methyl ester carboxylesterase
VVVLVRGWGRVLSADSFLDRLHRTPSLLDAAPRITAPCLVLKGEDEDERIYPVEEFAERCGGACEVVRLPDCDHFYRGRERRVADIVADWLAATVPPTTAG